MVAGADVGLDVVVVVAGAFVVVTTCGTDVLRIVTVLSQNAREKRSGGEFHRR